MLFKTCQFFGVKIFLHEMLNVVTYGKNIRNYVDFITALVAIIRHTSITLWH